MQFTNDLLPEEGSKGTNQFERTPVWLNASGRKNFYRNTGAVETCKRNSLKLAQINRFGLAEVTIRRLILLGGRIAGIIFSVFWWIPELYGIDLMKWWRREVPFFSKNSKNQYQISRTPPWQMARMTWATWIKAIEIAKKNLAWKGFRTDLGSQALLGPYLGLHDWRLWLKTILLKLEKCFILSKFSHQIASDVTDSQPSNYLKAQINAGATLCRFLIGWAGIFGTKKQYAELLHLSYISQICQCDQRST